MNESSRKRMWLVCGKRRLTALISSVM